MKTDSIDKTWLAGIAVVSIAVCGLLGVAIASVAGQSLGGDAPACMMVLLMVGVTILRPDLIKDDTNQVSAMRVAVLTLVAVFTLLTVKVSWGVTDPSQLSLDKTWAALVAAALGGKAAQSFSESMTPKVAAAAPKPSIAPQPALRVLAPGPRVNSTKLDETRGPANRPAA